MKVAERSALKVERARRPARGDRLLGVAGDLFLLLSGLPWAASWANYMTWALDLWPVTAGTSNWPVVATDQPLARRNQAPNAPHPGAAPMDGMPKMAGSAQVTAEPPDVEDADRTLTYPTSICFETFRMLYRPS